MIRALPGDRRCLFYAALENSREVLPGQDAVKGTAQDEVKKTGQRSWPVREFLSLLAG
jgi:hypothetical protein